MVEEEQQIKSKFSSGLNIIFRLDNLWKDTHLYSRLDQFYKWNNTLDCIWRELARDLVDDKKDETNNYDKKKEEIDAINKKIKDEGKFLDSRPSGFEDPTPEQLTSRGKHYEHLDEKQLFLARLENKLGKGTTEGDDEEDDID